MKQIAIVTKTTNPDLYDYLCSKYREYAVLHNNKELKGFKIVPIVESDIEEVENNG